MSVTPEELDQLLPQTQCGLCGYGGCMPYAEAMVYENAPPNLCPPGGVKTLRALGEKLAQDISSFVTDIENKTKTPTLAFIREAECIGCTKCIQVCPVDAIVGAAKWMHSVIPEDCTGCELCIPACPVDCIDLQQSPPLTEKAKTSAREHFVARQQRITQEKQQKNQRLAQQSLQKRLNYIAAALKRAKNKKSTHEKN